MLLGFAGLGLGANKGADLSENRAIRLGLFKGNARDDFALLVGINRPVRR